MSHYTIGDKIRILRTHNRFSQKGLALSAGLKQVNISYLENNKNKKCINPKKLEKIGQVLNMTVEEFLIYNPSKNMGELFNDVPKSQILLQSESLNNHHRIITLQHETIDILIKLNKFYSSKLENP